MSPPLILAERERPFWGFAELLLVAALFFPAVFAGAVAVKSGSGYLNLDPDLGFPMLVAEFIGYGIIFIVLKLMFTRHDEPLFSSLGWVRFPFKPQSLILAGFLLALVVLLLGNLLQMPETETPFEKLLEDPASRIAIAVFGVTLGPIVEELLFRGFMQPVMVDAIGVFPGILVTAALFGGMHLMQNGWAWQSGLLITFVGFVLGVIRHVTGSTRASSLAHISYNSLPFLALMFSQSATTPK